MTDPTPTRDEAVREVGRDDLKRRAVQMLKRNGWKPGDQFSAHSTTELMVALAIDAVKNPPDRCGWPECGCCHDASCNEASAPAPASGRVDAVAVLRSLISDCRYHLAKYRPAQLAEAEAFLASLSPAATPVSEAEPVAWRWRSRMKGGQWDAWEQGRYGAEVPPFMEVEEQYALAKPASSPAGGDVRRVRHKKRGGIYEVLGEAQIQTSRQLEDYEVVVIYRSLNTPDIDDPASPMKGDTWVRPKAEFNDGRFEELSQSTSAGRGE